MGKPIYFRSAVRRRIPGRYIWYFQRMSVQQKGKGKAELNKIKHKRKER